MDPRLFEAARTGNTTTLESLLQEDSLLLDLLSLSSPENPLHVSALSGQAGFTAEILRRKPDLAKELNHQGFTPLHIASVLGEVEVVRELLRVGQRDLCLVKSQDSSLPLHCAAQRGRSEVIKELVLVCCDALKEVTLASLETPLHVAVKNNQMEATKVLLEEMNKHGMSEIANWQNREGNTVLHLATLGKQLEIVEMLIGERQVTLGVNPNISNGRGLTPKDILDLVLETEGSGSSVSEMYKLVQLFQKAGAINGQEDTSTTLNRVHQPSSRQLNLWKILDYEIKNITPDQREALMVVAVLIATVTYQSFLTIPDTFKIKDNGGGGGGNAPPLFSGGLHGKKPVHDNMFLKSLRYFEVHIFEFYQFFNSVGFFASISMISLLTKRFPLRTMIRLCIISMMATYTATSPTVMTVTLSFCLVLRELALLSLAVSRFVWFFVRRLLF